MANEVLSNPSVQEGDFSHVRDVITRPVAQWMLKQGWPGGVGFSQQAYDSMRSSDKPHPDAIQAYFLGQSVRK